MRLGWGVQERRGRSPAVTLLTISEFYFNLNFVNLCTAPTNLCNVSLEYLVTATEIVPLALDCYHTFV
jgi:hypothetical protein